MSTKAQAQRIIASEKKFGQPVPFLLAPENDGRFLLYDGHQRLSAWLTIYGADYEMDAMVADRPLADDEHKELVITLHTGATGSWDWNALSGWDAPQLQEWGMNADALKDWNNDAENLKELLRAEQVAEDTEAEIDRAEELREKWGVKTGDLWACGEHRIICGDCTDAAVVERVMGCELCSLVVTDPPYGVSYADKNSFLNSIDKGNRVQTVMKNDHLNAEETQAMWKSAFSEMSKVMGKGAVVYCFMPQGGDQMMMMMMMMSAGIEPRHELIWLKNNHVLGRVDYAYKHEPILYAWKEGGHKFYGDFQTSIIECKKPQKSSLHPTMKPVELIEVLIKNSSLEDEIIYEPFSGSGTTLIACENLGRKCRAVEISPAYVSVALERWANHTGKTPVLIDTLPIDK